MAVSMEDQGYYAYYSVSKVGNMDVWIWLQSSVS